MNYPFFPDQPVKEKGTIEFPNNSTEYFPTHERFTFDSRLESPMPENLRSLHLGGTPLTPGLFGQGAANMFGNQNLCKFLDGNKEIG